MADDTDRAAASGERMGEQVVRVLADGDYLREGDVSVEWMILASINAIDSEGRLCRRPVVLCMRDLDPEARSALIELRPSTSEQPLL